jgi:hypothetical protein
VLVDAQRAVAAAKVDSANAAARLHALGQDKTQMQLLLEGLERARMRAKGNMQT